MGRQVYLLLGGRQIGKSSSIKSFILEMLHQGVEARQMFFLPCDTLVDRTELYEILKTYFANTHAGSQRILAIDEASFIKDWQLSVKALIDEGLTENTLILITGSDSILLEDAAAGFPGTSRRGEYGCDFHLHPLSFAEYRELTRQADQDLRSLFRDYLACGGFLSSINAYAHQRRVPEEVLSIYEQWLVSDFIRKGKDRRRLLDVLRVLLPRLATQVSFSELAQESSGLGTQTFIDYVSHLERLGILRVLGAFDQNTLGLFPKKAKKIHFRDPLIAHAVIHLLQRENLLASSFVLDEEKCVEAVVVETCARLGPVAYIKAAGEVDVVSIQSGTFTPIEVKWSERTRTSELKQILKYPHGLVLSKESGQGKLQHLERMNVLEFLLNCRDILG